MSFVEMKASKVTAELQWRNQVKQSSVQVAD